jgi:hypothetical protein
MPPIIPGSNDTRDPVNLSHFSEKKDLSGTSWYYRNVMDAITYLVSRKQISPYKISGILLLVAVAVWINFNALDYASSAWPELARGEFTDFVLTTVTVLTGLASFAVLAGIILALPLHSLSSICGTLRSWSENRILEELTSTGLTTRYLVDQLLLHHLRRWAIISLPALLFGAFCTEGYGGLVADGGWLVYLGAVLGIYMTGFCVTAWRVSAGRRGWLFLAVPVTILAGAPSIVMSTVSPLEPSNWIFTSVFVIVAGRFLAIRALDNQASFSNISFKFRRSFSIRRSNHQPLSENPIVARQEMAGREFGDLMALVGMAVVLLWAYFEAFVNTSPVPVYVALLSVGFVAAWRAASRLSQSLTQELEGSTLETIRSTPMGSERFLNGWLQIAVGPLAKEVALFVLLSFPSVLMVQGVSGLTNGHFVHCVLLTLAAPYLGGLFGASIAGQCKPRHEVSGQITATVMLCGLLSAPQMAILLSEESSWISIVPTLIFLRLASWVLKAGANKSLNRVFLPQK